MTREEAIHDIATAYYGDNEKHGISRSTTYPYLVEAFAALGVDESEVPVP